MDGARCVTQTGSWAAYLNLGKHCTHCSAAAGAGEGGQHKQAAQPELSLRTLMHSTPLERKMSRAFSPSRSRMNMLKRYLHSRRGSGW